MYPPPHIITQILIFLLGFIVGGTVVFEFFKDGISGPWAAFAGAAGGAIITVIGLSSFEDRRENRRKAREDAAISQEMVPHLITLRGELRNAVLLLEAGGKKGRIPSQAIRDKIDQANNSWKNVQPMLGHFSDTALNRYRLGHTLDVLKENSPGLQIKPVLLRATKLANDLAARFKVDDVDLG